MNKVFRLALICTMVLLFSLTAFADVGVLSLGRVSVLMPELTVEIKGKEYGSSSISAALGAENLEIGDVHVYDKAVDSTCAYILVDLSTSMTRSFDLVKNNIISYINSMGTNDKLVLITFGENEVKTVLNGSESRADAIAVIQGLESNENGTMFYEALSQAYKLSSSSTDNFSREYVIAFSDGIDVQKGNTTFDEVQRAYDSHFLPIYAACSINNSLDAKEGSDRFGELARLSGGSLCFIDNESTFTQFIEDINNVTLIKLRASTNNADGTEKQLTLKIDDLQTEYSVPITRSLADTVAPVVNEFYYDSSRNMFVVMYSEGVTGALSDNSYKITDSKGKSIKIASIYYSETDDVYELTPETQIINDTYTVTFSGITDSSQEKNSLDDAKTVEITDIVTEKKEEVFPIWVIALIVAGVFLLIALIVVVFVVMSKKSEDNSDGTNGYNIPVKGGKEVVDYVQGGANEVKHHIKTNDVIRIRLKIKTGKTAEQTIETNIVSSIIVGRSDTCDIYIDDLKLSRQHFAIENDNGRFFIMDLQSRNGTMLNGIRINSRQEIKSGDKVLAGLSDIMIVVLGR